MFNISCNGWVGKKHVRVSTGVYMCVRACTVLLVCVTRGGIVLMRVCCMCRVCVVCVCCVCVVCLIFYFRLYSYQANNYHFHFLHIPHFQLFHTAFFSFSLKSPFSIFYYCILCAQNSLLFHFLVIIYLF